MTISIPVGLIHRFVASVADQGESVAPFLFVSHAACSAARRIIFRNITFRYEPAASWITRKFMTTTLLAALQGNESLLTLVESITITFKGQVGGHWEDPEPEELDLDEDEEVPEPYPDPDFAPLLELLSKAPIVTLKLQADITTQRYGQHFNMADLTPSIMRHLVTLRCTPSLRHLTLDYLGNMPVLLVTGNPSTDRLTSLNMVRFPMPIRSGYRTLTPFKTGPDIEKDIKDLPPCLSGIAKDNKNFPFQYLERLDMSDATSFPRSSCRTIADAIALENSALSTPLADECAEAARYRAVCRVADHPARSFTFPALKTFRTGLKDLEYRDVEVISELFRYAPNLDTVIIQGNLAGRVGSYPEATAFVGDCFDAKTIRHLHIKHVGLPKRRIPTMSAIVLMLAGSSGRRSALETLTLELSWAATDMIEKSMLRKVFSPTKKDWKHLKDVCAGLPKLKKLTLDFTVIEGEYDPSPKQQKFFEGLIKALAADLSRGGELEVEYTAATTGIDIDEEDMREDDDGYH